MDFGNFGIKQGKRDPLSIMTEPFTAWDEGPQRVDIHQTFKMDDEGEVQGSHTTLDLL